MGATVVRAGAHQVLPLDVEEVRKATAESAPQDWELTAGKRLIARLRSEHPQMALSVIGDDLYSQVPFIEQLQLLRQPYVVVAKPNSHPTLRAAVAAAEGDGAESDRAVDRRQWCPAEDLYLSARTARALGAGEHGTRHLCRGLGT